MLFEALAQRFPALSPAPGRLGVPDEFREVIDRVLRKKGLLRSPEEELLRDRREMFMGSLFSFVITLTTVIPVIVPLMVIRDFGLALTVASGMASVCLFFTGYYMAPYVGYSRWKTGLGLAAMGWAITIAATFTGG